MSRVLERLVAKPSARGRRISASQTTPSEQEELEVTRLPPDSFAAVGHRPPDVPGAERQVKAPAAQRKSRDRLPLSTQQTPSLPLLDDAEMTVLEAVRPLAHGLLNAHIPHRHDPDARSHSHALMRPLRGRGAAGGSKRTATWGARLPGLPLSGKRSSRRTPEGVPSGGSPLTPPCRVRGTPGSCGALLGRCTRKTSSSRRTGRNRRARVTLRLPASDGRSLATE